jgi:Methyltransferase domain
MKRKSKNLIKNTVSWIFKTGQKIGVDILPRHFYSQVPDIAELQKDLYWKLPFEMVGVRGMELKDQIQFINQICSGVNNSDLNKVHENAIAENGEGGGYGPIEAEFLFCFVKKIKPAKVIQVGCGVSTAIILRAAQSAGYSPRIVCVEPFPTPYLMQLEKKGLIKLIKEKAQKVEEELLLDLSSNDLFFVDSTHTVKAGSEVNKIILQVLPKMPAGVWVHFHDIVFPYDYTRNLLNGDLFFWGESTLLHAFLINNDRFAVKLCQSFIHYNSPESLKSVFADYIPRANDEGLEMPQGDHFPSSLYLITN